MVSSLRAVRDYETAINFQRPLGAVEKMLWLSDSHRPNHIAIAAEIDGAAAPRAWQSAVDALVRKDPTVIAAINRDQHGEPQFGRGDAGRLSVHFIDAPAGVWCGHLARHLAQPFLASESPLLRVTVILDGDRTAVVLSALRAIADAKGLAYWLRDLLTLVSGGTVVRSVSKGSVETLVAGMLGALPKVAVDRDDTHYLPRVLDGLPPAITLASLTPSQNARLRTAAHARSTCVHGALCAAFSEALRQSEDRERSVTVTSPIDLRHRFLDGPEHLGMCAIGLTVPEADPAADFWERARSYSRAFDAALAPYDIRRALGTMESVAASLTSGRQAIDAVARISYGEVLISNIADMDLPTDYGDMTLDAVWGPSSTFGFEGEQTIGAVTHNGSLRLVHTSYAPIPDLLFAAIDKLAAVGLDAARV